MYVPEPDVLWDINLFVIAFRRMQWRPRRTELNRTISVTLRQILELKKTYQNVAHFRYFYDQITSNSLLSVHKSHKSKNVYRCVLFTNDGRNSTTASRNLDYGKPGIQWFHLQSRNTCKFWRLCHCTMVSFVSIDLLLNPKTHLQAMGIFYYSS